ncbi:MAG: HPP family protein [Chloroflexi bacterium]|nr:HPP family protein [Chloroflexota bacterium]
MDDPDKEAFVTKPRNHVVIQCLIATLAVAVILLSVANLTHALIIGALGSSAFIVLGMPSSRTACPKKLIGGHLMGLVSGALSYYVFLSLLRQSFDISPQLYLIPVAAALAVGLSLFLMVVTHTEHPPAAGTALSVVVMGWSYQLAAFVLLSMLGLAATRKLLKRHLRDLV